MFSKTHKDPATALKTLAALADDADQYEYNVFYDAASDSHVLVHQKLSPTGGMQSLKTERWSGKKFVDTAA